MNTLEIITNKSSKTKRLGVNLSKILKSGDVVLLIGDLGSGKTTFVQGIAKGLNIKMHISSPSFTIINEYEGRIPFYHIDLYRLDRIEEIVSLGIKEYIFGEGIVVVEWGEKIKDLIEEYIEINFNFLEKDKRLIKFSLPKEKFLLWQSINPLS
jgi:tRNA threonylcarbamoyladenosine biosynthesis protein TsaE